MNFAKFRRTPCLQYTSGRLLLSGLRPNKSKRKVASTRVLKGVKMAICGMESINLTSDSMKILGIQFSYNKQITIKENFFKSIVRLKAFSNSGE